MFKIITLFSILPSNLQSHASYKMCNILKVSKYTVPGHSTKNHRPAGHWLTDAFPDLLKGPSSPPGTHWPRPVAEPSSHQPHPGRVWHSSHVFIPEHFTANKQIYIYLGQHTGSQTDVVTWTSCCLRTVRTFHEPNPTCMTI